MTTNNDFSPNPLKVGVIFGGRSSEHSVSCISAANVMAALSGAGYAVVPIGISTEGHWAVLEQSQLPSAFALDEALPQVKDGNSVILQPAPLGGALVTADAVSPLQVLSSIDVIFPILHGPYGEDGTVQGLFELAGIPYVGSGVLASALAMDKVYSKKLADSHGIAVGPYLSFDGYTEITAESVKSLGLPLFVKPARGGSSVGISKVKNYDELPAAIAVAREHDRRIIVEAGVIGREIECAVLEGEYGQVPLTTVPAEIRMTSGQDWYDFATKYLPGGACVIDVPADLPEAVTAEVRRLSAEIFTLFNCSGLARVDFFVTDDGGVYFNEINTMPGFTPTSMYPQLWANSGVSYEELIKRLVALAMASGTGLR